MCPHPQKIPFVQIHEVIPLKIFTKTFDSFNSFKIRGDTAEKASNIGRGGCSFFLQTQNGQKKRYTVCRPRDCVGMERASTAYLWAGAMWGVPGGGQRRCLPTADLRAEAGVTTQRGMRGPRHEAEFGTLFEKGCVA